MMNKNHNFEFKKHRFLLIAYFICTSITEVSNIIKLEYYQQGEEPHSLEEKYVNYCHIKLNPFESDEKYSVLFVQNLVTLEALLVVFTVIKLKSTDDVLQGVNKLDYFIKASVFQIYKKSLRQT